MTWQVKFCGFTSFWSLKFAFSSQRESFLHIDEDGEAAVEEEVVETSATEEGQWQANPRFKTRTNTSTKRSARFTCWKSTRRLTGDHPKTKENGCSNTHVYAKEGCLHFFKLLKPAWKHYWANNPMLIYPVATYSHASKVNKTAYLPACEPHLGPS
jgi:hypothetical protein